MGSPSAFRDRIIAGAAGEDISDIESAIYYDEIVGSINFDTPDLKEGIWVRGFYKAPRTGTYNVWASADDGIEVYMNLSPGIIDREA